MPSDDTTTTTKLQTDLRRLGLTYTADQLNDLIALATRKRWSHTVLLEHIVAAELEEKQRRSVESRLKRARLGRFKPLADWDWDWPTALDRTALERILTLDFLARGADRRPELLQVCADLSDAAVVERELRALAAAGEQFPDAGQRLLTLDRDGIPSTLPDGVIVEPAYEWMLNHDAPS